MFPRNIQVTISERRTDKIGFHAMLGIMAGVIVAGLIVAIIG